MKNIETITSDEKVVLITGDRNWDDFQVIHSVLRTFSLNTVIVHGFADGADSIADVVAGELGLRSIRCPAHWRHNTPRVVQTWGPCDPDCAEMVGRAAGAIRNHWMLDTYYPEEVHAFHNDLVESKGTREMVTYAQKKNVPVTLHTGDKLWQQPPVFIKARTPVQNPLASEFFDFS